MFNDIAHPKLYSLTWFLPAHDSISICDAPNIFHGSILVVWAHHVIEFGERISGAEVALIEIQRRLSDAEHELVAQVLDEGLAHKDALGHVHRVKVLEHLVGAGTNGVQVGRDLGCLLELVDGNVLALIVIERNEPLNTGAFKNVLAVVGRITVTVTSLLGVTNCAPVDRAENDQRHLGLKIRLVEAREDAEAVECLEL